jgi:hypothetical protein
LIKQLALRLDWFVVLFGIIAVAAFWFAIQLCWSVVGKPWYSIAGRLVGALALLGLGVLMIFYTAFGS